ncbi:MAG: C_GCAxxG_C_C family protein [Clostridia bacterium]|nr:C_GCAxxG_C_C family protein [Clostridia bacterium]
MDHKMRARELFCSGYNCAQAVFTAFADVTGMEEKEALRLSSSFGGGMGRLRETCGAVTGMFMVAGALWGYDDVSDPSVITDHYARIQDMAAKFKEKYNTICCRQLLEGLETTTGPVPTPRDAEFYKKRPCLIFVEYAAEILDQMIAEKK